MAKFNEKYESNFVCTSTFTPLIEAIQIIPNLFKFEGQENLRRSIPILLRYWKTLEPNAKSQTSPICSYPISP